MRGQLGDAPGFGEMQGIFAQAYQQSLGRTGDQALNGQKAIEELNKAMEKGQVISAKILPYVAEIAKQMAAGGIDEARLSSFAEQNRFQNQMSMGWKAFREGGGESGLAFFWRIMQRMGAWWETNGAALGKGFETAIYWFDAIRLGVGEFASFLSTGESNSFTEWVSQFGINLQAYREEISQMFKTLGDIFGVSEGVDLKTRIQNFGIRLQEILQQVNVVLSGIAKFLDNTGRLYNRKWYEAYAGFNPFSDVAKEQRGAASGIYQAIGGVFGATTSAAAIGGDQIGLSSPNRTDYALYGNAKGGFGSPTPVSENRDWMTSPSAVLPSNASNSSVVLQKQTLDVNLNVTGNPDVINQLIDRRSRESFPLLLSSEIAKSVTSAAKNQ